jgi:tetratricopeptide (TPR) repeat protein
MQQDIQPAAGSVHASVPRPRRFSFDIATTIAVLGTVVLAGIAFIPAASIPFMFTKVSILAIGTLVTLVLYILARLTRGNAIVPPLPLLGALWLVPLAYLLSALFSGVGLRAGFFGTDIETDTLGFVLILAALATLTALSFRRVPSLKLAFKAGALFLGLVVVVQALVLIVSRIAPTKVSATTNLIGSFSDLGMVVGLGITIALLALRFLKVSPRVRLALFIGGGLGLLALAVVNSTIVWGLVVLVAFGLFIEAIMKNRVSAADDSDLDGVALMLAENEQEGGDTHSRSLVAPLVTLAIGLFFLIGGSTIGNAVVNAFGANVIDVRPSWTSTFEVGSHTYASSPVFGSGPGTFGSQWLKFRDRALNDTVFWNVDFGSGVGYVPTSFVTTGVVGALAWVVFLGLFLFMGLRMLLLRAPSDPFVRFASMASFTGFIYVMALAILAVPGPIVLLLGFIFAGLFISTMRYGAQAREWGIIFTRSPRVGFVIVFGLTLLLLASILATYVVIERYLASVAYNEASIALAAGKFETADAAINRSILFAPSDRAYQVAAAIGIARMREVAADTTLGASEAQQRFQAALSKAIQDALAATKINPNNYQNWVMLGNVYGIVVPLKIDGAYDNAKTAYDRAIALNPTNPSLLYVLAQLEIAQGNGVAAEETLIQTITLKRDYTQAIFLLSQLEVQLGKAKEALQAAEAAAYFAPNDATVIFQVGILRSANGDTPGAIAALARSVELNPQYANARFFLGVMYAISGDLAKAITELEAVAAISPENAEAVANDLAALRNGKNPFPQSRLGALGIPQKVTEAPAPATTTGQ